MRDNVAYITIFSPAVPPLHFLALMSLIAVIGLNNELKMTPEVKRFRNRPYSFALRKKKMAVKKKYALIRNVLIRHNAFLCN